jgi:murein DD-endopeptidase MepM/ murein hydrolase activator NlpD
LTNYVYPFSRKTDYPNSHWDNAKAVDVFGSKGSNIVACTDAWATVDNFSLGGHTVTLRGDDGRYYYHAHLVQNTGKRGRVRMGEKIGEMDNTGNAGNRPTHCHWAVGSAAYGIDTNGAGDIAPWPLLDQWFRQGIFPADSVAAGPEVAQLEAEVARLNELITLERSWGSAIIVHVIKPGFTLLNEAVAGNEVDQVKVAQVRTLLGAHGGTA